MTMAAWRPSPFLTLSVWQSHKQVLNSDTEPGTTKAYITILILRQIETLCHRVTRRYNISDTDFAVCFRSREAAARLFDQY
jgi:hypothetical protein